MPDENAESRRICWSDLLPFTPIFRGFKLAIDVRKLILATAAVLIIYLSGRVLDGIWPKGSSVVVSDDGVSELLVFLKSDLNCAETSKWIKDVGKKKSSTRAGVFDTLLNQSRSVALELNEATLRLSPGGVIRGLIHAAGVKVWLTVMHPFYAAIYLLVVWLPVWSFFGAAICRIAAMQAAREERLPITDALAFARSKFWSFVAAPLLPLGVILVIGLLLVLGGLFGAIPAVGTLIAPLFFFLAIVGGFIIALVIVLLAIGAPLMYPTIAVEGSDAFDALSRSFSYVGERIWRALLYFAVALVYGTICFVFVKLVARLALFAAHFFVGLTMNIGDASGVKTDLPHKLDAMWQAPALDFSTPFYGVFDHSVVAGWSAFGRFLIMLWVFGVFAIVAGFLISYYHSASTLVYFLLRRDVDATDMEEVFVDTSDQPPPAGQPAETPPPAPASSPGSLASLPVVGQTQPQDGH